MTEKTTHALPQWTEVEYTALCKSPYLSRPFFVPKQTQCFLCREDGTREEMRMIFLVFKPVGIPMETEWDDDPTPGELWVKALGDDDEDVEPVKVVYLGMDIDKFISVVHEDDDNIIFDIYWRYGKVKVDKAEVTDEGFACRKADFGEGGLLVTLTPDEGEPFTMRLQIPYIGFSLLSPDGEKLHGDVEVPHDKVSEYSYTFVGDASNDRFSLNLDNDKLVYMCVLRPEDGTMVVRDTRERLAVVDEIKSEGSLQDLLMGAHQALVKNKNYRWRIQVGGSSVVSVDELTVDAKSLVHFAHEQYEATSDKDGLGAHLIMLEPKYGFQWCWLSPDEWSHDDAAFDMFMHQLVAFSYVSQKPIQGDLLQARNNKRKIRRCAKMLVEHQRGHLSLWDASEEERRELMNLFGTFHAQFLEAVEEAQKLDE